MTGESFIVLVFIMLFVIFIAEDRMFKKEVRKWQDIENAVTYDDVMTYEEFKDEVEK